MNSASNLDSVWIRQSGQAGNGVLHILVSEPRFRRFYKMILKFLKIILKLFMKCIAFVMT